MVLGGWAFRECLNHEGESSSVRLKVKVKVKWLSRVWLFATPWTVAHQAPPSIRFSRQQYWSGLPFPSPGDLPNPGIKPGSPALQADPSEPAGNPISEISALKKRQQRVTGPFCDVRTQWEVCSLQPGRRLSPGLYHAGILLSDLPPWAQTSSPQTVSNKCLLFEATQSVVFHSSSPNGLGKLPLLSAVCLNMVFVGQLIWIT